LKITTVEDLHCDAGWRVFSFLKISTDEGIVGYSEYNESYGSRGLSAVILALAEDIKGRDPRPIEGITAELYATTRQAPGGMIQQAIAAIENALLDIKGKALGVPVYALFGGPVRDRLRLYWSHCGTYRIHHADILGKPQLRSRDDLVALGCEVRESGMTGLKCNIYVPENGGFRLHMPGFRSGPEMLQLNAEREVVDALRDQVQAIREGCGDGVDILVDLNFNFKTEGYLKVVRALEDLGLMWVEIDSFDPMALRDIRTRTNVPLASCESLFGRRGFKPYFEAHSVDVAIVDIPWNGLAEGVKIAAMAEAYEVNVAPHNFYGHLSTLMSAHFCATLPNFRIMEIDIDDVPWKDELVTVPPVIEDGHLVLPSGPGWGADINEEAVRAYPPKR